MSQLRVDEITNEAGTGAPFIFYNSTDSGLPENNIQSAIDALAALSGGGVLQIVQGSTDTAMSTTSTTFQDTGLEATITREDPDSKILVFVSDLRRHDTNTSNTRGIESRLLRNGDEIIRHNILQRVGTTGGGPHTFTDVFVFFDSDPTATLTYKIQLRRVSTFSTARSNHNGDPFGSVIILIEVKV